MTDLAKIEAIARLVLEHLPAPFDQRAQDILLRVEDWPDKTLLEELGISDPLDLTGLYDGIPITEKSISDPSPWPDTIWLFREPILDELSERPGETLERLVTHVMVHELAHHFGWSDSDIARIDKWWE